MFSKKDIWILYFITGLGIFFILTIHFLRPWTEHNDSYNYDSIVKYLSNEVEELTYGNDEYNLEQYDYLSNSIEKTKSDISQSYSDLKENYRNNQYNLSEYLTIKRRYEFNIKILDQSLELLNKKVPK